MKPPETKLEYYGSTLCAVRWLGEDVLSLTLRLDPDWNDRLARESELVFYGVGNRSIAESALGGIEAKVREGGGVASVVALRRTADGAFSLEFTNGALVIEADSFAEV